MRVIRVSDRQGHVVESMVFHGRKAIFVYWDVCAYYRDEIESGKIRVTLREEIYETEAKY